jgi:hypothetical protein
MFGTMKYKDYLSWLLPYNFSHIINFCIKLLNYLIYSSNVYSTTCEELSELITLTIRGTVLILDYISNYVFYDISMCCNKRTY